MSIERDPELARRIRVKFAKMRADRELTYEEMGRLCHVHPSNYHLYESGDRMPTITTLKKMCEGLGVSSYDILGF